MAYRPRLRVPDVSEWYSTLRTRVPTNSSWKNTASCSTAEAVFQADAYSMCLRWNVDWENLTNFEKIKYFCSILLYICTYTGWPKKRPELSHGVMQQSMWNESAEKHVCNEQTSANMSVNFHLKRSHISRDTSKIVLHVIKQRMQAFRHLCCWLCASYTRTSQ